MKRDNLLQLADNWFQSKGWKVFPFQQESWNHVMDGYSGLVNAPTGSGKTYSLFMGALLDFMQKNEDWKEKSKNGIQIIWITPIRALAKEIAHSCTRAIEGLGLQWQVQIRTGDTTTTDRNKIQKNPPEVLITTPESLHVIFATKDYPAFFNTLNMIVVDEWHELIGSKRGVQTELAIAMLRHLNPELKIWGISATIGNMQEAVDVLLFPVPEDQRKIVKADIKKEVVIETLLPDEVEKFSWAGHYGIAMAEKVAPLIQKYKSTLIFTNTRAQCELWYQRLLDIDPELAGQMAMHHGSISREIRDWVEEALYEGKIKAVVCTSSLDLGVDFRPVESIVQIGSPKGVSRFLQRAGRSGHQPGAVSRIYFVPTHSLELSEAAGLRMAIENTQLEDRIPYIRSFDVLVQFLMTLAVSDGFYPEEIYEVVKNTYCFESMDENEWQQVISMLVYGSSSLQAYDEFRKISVGEDGRLIVKEPSTARKHKMSIGTIVSDAMMQIKLLKGTRIGTVEEWFIAQLSPGDTFWFAGRALELVRVKDMTAQVRISNAKNGKIPSYQGGRMPLSSQMSDVVRDKIHNFTQGVVIDPEMTALRPLLELQAERSILPDKDQFLIEYFESREGYHILMYPYEGRNVHEGMGALIAKRISMQMPVSFTIAMNDIGFELLTDRKIDPDLLIQKSLFSTQNLTSDIQSSINSVEMARRRFRDIARISGLIFSGYPGKPKKDRHLQASSQLLFEVFKEYEPDNLLFRQTYDEVLTFQLEEERLRNALERIQRQEMIIKKPGKFTPFAFPIIVDRLREKLTSEKLEDRIQRMKLDAGG
jgi:ATP-dependent Lhr-like helicase